MTRTEPPRKIITPTKFVQEWLDSLIAKDAADVFAEVKAVGEQYQITKRDGAVLATTRDYRPCRLSVEVEGGLITKACFG